MKILLFGKSGQVGSALLPVLSSFSDLAAIGRDRAGGISGDFEQPVSVADAVLAGSPDVVVNAAAYTAVDRAEEEADLAHTINAEAPIALAHACRERKALLVHYSTDYIFSGAGTRPWHEDDPADPINVYGRTKFAGEEGIRQSGCQYLIFRTSWVYSAKGHNFLRTMLRLSTERDELNIVDDQWGVPTDTGLIATVTGRMIRAVQRATVVGGVYHLTPRGETTWYRYACHAIARARALGWPVRVPQDEIRPVGTDAFPTLARRPLNSRLDCHKLELVMKEKMPDWRDGVDAVLDTIINEKRREKGS